MALGIEEQVGIIVKAVRALFHDSALNRSHSLMADWFPTWQGDNACFPQPPIPQVLLLGTGSVGQLCSSNHLLYQGSETADRFVGGVFSVLFIFDPLSDIMNPHSMDPKAWSN